MLKLLSGVVLTITSSPHGGEDFGLGRREYVAVRTGEEVGTRIGRARMIEGRSQRCGGLSLLDILFCAVVYLIFNL